MNVRTILSAATAAAGLVSAGLAANYDHLIRQGYRWVSVDGPLACASKDDLRQMIGKPSDELTLKMVEEVRAYYLIRGSMVRVVAQETSSGLSHINIPGITQNLWTLTKFLTKQPVKDIIGRIETPNTLTGATATPTASPTARRYGIGNTFVDNNRSETESGEYPWRPYITTTVFWVGEQSVVNAAISNEQSAWDSDWFASYGGYDDPSLQSRRNFVPIDFLPHQNPFYVALPYNDVDDQHHTKPEAPQVIPWFRNAFVRDGQSVCKGRWIEIRHKGRVCYAQWEDVGPFETDDLEYVFGGQRPRPNPNGDAGLDVSPAVRDYLGLGDIDFCDWRFVDFTRVPLGPWAFYGDNNTFLRHRPKAVVVVKPSAKPF